MLTPEEIQSREFLVALRGYDRDEVHAFLDEVAASFAQLRTEAGEEGAPSDAPTPDDRPGVADESAEGATAPSSPFAAIAAETQKILEAAQSAGEEMRARARAEAEQTREELVSAAEAEMAGLREQAVAARRELDVLRLRREMISDQLRQARETAELALMELEVEEDPTPADPTAEDLTPADPTPEDPVTPQSVLD